MAKQSTRPKSPRKRNERKKQAKPRNTIAIIVTALVFLGASAAGLAAYKRGWEQERDLSVVGNGTPSVIQVHDAGCSLCQKLKSNTDSALRGIDDEQLQYRVADINTARGRAFQNKHHVQHVTLLLFDGGGDLQRTITGVTSTATLKDVFRNFAEKQK